MNDTVKVVSTIVGRVMLMIVANGSGPGSLDGRNLISKKNGEQK